MIIILIITIVLLSLLYINSKSNKENYLDFSSKEKNSNINLEVFPSYKNKNQKKFELSVTQDPEFIKRVLNLNDYSSEKKKVSYTDIKEPRRYIRYFLDENRHNYIKDIPFSPHIILQSYDDVDLARVIEVKNKLNKINLLTPFNERKFEASTDISDTENLDLEASDFKKDYCIIHKHKPECILAERKYKCFGKLEFSKKECEAETDLIGNRVEPGIWDRMCVNNEDCPFYKANKNYPNEFGRCRTDGNCEFPRGIKRLSYRKYLKSSLPLCYNCKNEKGNLEIGYCCNTQKTPDYFFENDLPDRFKNRKILEEKGLMTVNHDDYTKEFRKLEKKLKI